MIPFLTALLTLAAFALMAGGIYCAVCQLVLALPQAARATAAEPKVSILPDGIANAGGGE